MALDVSGGRGSATQKGQRAGGHFTAAMAVVDSWLPVSVAVSDGARSQPIPTIGQDGLRSMLR